MPRERVETKCSEMSLAFYDHRSRHQINLHLTDIYSWEPHPKLYKIIKPQNSILETFDLVYTVMICCMFKSAYAKLSNIELTVMKNKIVH